MKIGTGNEWHTQKYINKSKVVILGKTYKVDNPW
jgi:hypothetical protein